MEDFAKVEKIVDVTGVSFEDAREALKVTDGDVLESVVYLEKIGKANTANYGAKTVKAETSRDYSYVYETETYRRTSSGFGEFVRKVMRFLTHNKIEITKNDELIASLPLLVVLIICNISIGFALVLGFVSMMFGYEYSFKGESDLSAANRVLAQAGTTAGHVKAEYDRL